jgi:GTP-dependent dephospho-CoA kinase
MEITPAIRELLKKPLGALVKDASGIPKSTGVVAIVDSASDALLSVGIEPKMLVYDGMTQRQSVGISDKIRSYDAKEYRVKNPAGHLEKGVFDLFKKLLKSKDPSRVFVVGEEDLTALAAIVESPLGYVVVYGQPNEGLVIVEVNEKSKSIAKSIIEEMEDGS